MNDVSTPKKAKPPLRPGSIPKTFIRGEALSKKTQARTTEKEESAQKPAPTPYFEETPNPNVDWFETRIARAETSAYAISRKLKPGSKNWLNKIIKGSQQLALGEIRFLAQQLDVHPIELIHELGYRLPKMHVKLVGVVGSDSQIRYVSAEQQIEVMAPPTASHRTVAVECKFGGLMFGFLSGHVLYFNDDKDKFIHADAIGKLCVFWADDVINPFVGMQQPGPLESVKILLLDGTNTVITRKLRGSSPVLWTRAT